MHAVTVQEPVDRHIAPLVDAINRSGRARTYSSCSGHMTEAGFPYVGFRTQGWDFAGEVRRRISQLTDLIIGQTLLEIRSFSDENVVEAVIRFRMYPWLWVPRIDLSPLAAQLVPPPPRLVRLWWAEIAELARMIEEDDGPSAAAAEFFRTQRRSQRGFPWWGTRGVSINPCDGSGHVTPSA